MTGQVEEAMQAGRVSAPSAEELVRAHYRMQEGRFLSAVEFGQNGIHCASEVAAPMWNHSTWIGDAAGFEAFIDEAKRFQSSRRRAPVIYLAPSAGLEETLRKKGFEEFDRESWMVRASGARRGETDLAIEEVGEATRQKFAQVFAAAFNVSLSDYSALLWREPENESAIRHVVAREGEEIIAVGSVAILDGVGCIYNVGTAPAKRGRGAGRAVLEALAQIAQDEDCAWVFLQVEAGSGAERIYAKAGFRPVLARVGYRKADWKQTTWTESALSKALGFRAGAGRAWGQERETRALSPQTFSKLKALGDQSFAAAWAILLSRYLGEREVAFNFGTSTTHYTIDDEARAAVFVMRSGNTVTDGILPDTQLVVGALNEFDHALCVGVDGDKIEVRYQSALFGKETIRRLANHFGTLLDSISTQPDARIEDLQMLGGEERREILENWGAGSAIAWKGETIVDLLRAQAKKTPHAVALLAGESEDHLTYAQMFRQADAVAALLAQSGLKPGGAVGVMLPRSLDFAVALLGIWRAGGIFVPLDTSYPAERTEFMLKDAKAQVVLTLPAVSEALPKVAGVKMIHLDQEYTIDKKIETAPKSTDTAYIIYTSGSTGQPKGVAITHAALAKHVVAMREHYEITSADRHLHFSPFTFDASFEQLLPPLVAGASVVIRGERLWDHEEFARKAAELELTMADVPMAYWQKLAHEAASAGEGFLPKRMRLFIAGGEAMSIDGLIAWQTGPLADRRLVNAYGPTEATITATACEAGTFKLSEDLAGAVPIGRPLPGRSIYILDRTLHPLPARVAGEIYIGGDLLAVGYLNRAELTAERFIPNPFAPNQRIYRTGDLGRWLEDGSIEFLGRADDQVKIRGFRVELGEIEGALRKHEGIRDVVVLARDAGGAQKRLVAYIVARTDGPHEGELRRWLGSHLPEFMVPSSFVFLDEFQLLPSGKVNRKALPEPGSTSGIDSSGASPKTPLELQLQLIFQRVLRRVGIPIDASFFELGGDSLQALELILQIEKGTGKRLPLETLFHAPSVESLAREIQKRGAGAEWSALVPLQRSGVLPPLFLIHTTPGDVLGYGNLIHHLGIERPCYGFQAFGLKESALAHDTIEGMASAYLKLLREFQPKGPYYLGGWCFGGIVAVEMAQQLLADGQEIASLLLMETVSVPPGLSNFEYHANRLKNLFRMRPARWKAYLHAKARYRLQVEQDNRMRFKAAGRDVDPEEQQWLDKLERVYNANLSALKRYRSRYYPGKVTLFNAVEKDPAVLPDPNYGWVGLAREIEIHEVAGNHDTMLAEPHVSSLAQAMRRVLSNQS